MQKGDFLSGGKENIDEEMVQMRVLENYWPVYKLVAVKPLAKPDAAGTVTQLC